MNTALGARLVRKQGRVRVTEGDSLNLSLLPLFSPFARTEESIVHMQCHLGSPSHYCILWHICLGFLLS